MKGFNVIKMTNEEINIKFNGSDSYQKSIANFIRRVVINEASCYRLIGFSVDNKQCNILASHSSMCESFLQIIEKVLPLNLYIEEEDRGLIVEETKGILNGITIFNCLSENVSMKLYYSYDFGYKSDKDNFVKLPSNATPIKSYHSNISSCFYKKENEQEIDSNIILIIKGTNCVSTVNKIIEEYIYLFSDLFSAIEI